MHDELAGLQRREEERDRLVSDLDVLACLLIEMVGKQSLPNADEPGPAPGP